MKRNRKAKILATLGPASSDINIIEELFVAGCDVFRLNFSHGDLETHRKNYENIRSLEEKHNHASCILADLQGPKLRVGTFKNTKENLVKGQDFILDLSTELHWTRVSLISDFTPGTDKLALTTLGWTGNNVPNLTKADITFVQGVDSMSAHTLVMVTGKMAQDRGFSDGGVVSVLLNTDASTLSKETDVT